MAVEDFPSVIDQPHVLEAEIAVDAAPTMLSVLGRGALIASTYTAIALGLAHSADDTPRVETAATVMTVEEQCVHDGANKNLGNTWLCPTLDFAVEVKPPGTFNPNYGVSVRRHGDRSVHGGIEGFPDPGGTLNAPIIQGWGKDKKQIGSVTVRPDLHDSHNPTVIVSR